MDWRAALRSRATGLASGRVYWAERPQGSGLPALVLTAVSDARPQTLKGWDLASGRVQVDSYGNTPLEAWNLAEDALSALVSGGTYGGHNFSRADVAIGLRDLTDRVAGKTVFRVSMDLIFHHAMTEEGS